MKYVGKRKLKSIEFSCREDEPVSILDEKKDIGVGFVTTNSRNGYVPFVRVGNSNGDDSTVTFYHSVLG